MRPTYKLSNTVVFVADSDPEYQSNAGLYERNCEVFFDASHSQKGFREVLDRTKGKCKYLVISHAHQDHYFGLLNELSWFEKIFCGSPMAEILLDNGIVREDLCILNVQNPQITVGDMQVMHCENCHTTSDIFLVGGHDRVAFLGDLYIRDRHPLLEQDRLQNLYQVLKKVYYLQVDVFVPGHGWPADRSEFKKYLDYLEFLIMAVSQYYSKNHILQWMEEHGCEGWKYEEYLWKTCRI